MGTTFLKAKHLSKYFFHPERTYSATEQDFDPSGATSPVDRLGLRLNYNKSYRKFYLYTDLAINDWLADVFVAWGFVRFFFSVIYESYTLHCWLQCACTSRPL